MLRTRFAIAGLSAAALSLVLVACGSSTETQDNTPADETGAQPPGPGPEKAADGASDTVLAIKKLYLGDTDRNDQASETAWKQFGYNLDGKISTKDSTDLCKPAKGGVASKVYPDGNDGIDNAFGHSMVPLIKSLSDSFSTSVNDSILKGSFTVMLDLHKLGADAAYNPIETGLYGGANFGDTPPKWDGTDQWPLISELLNNGDKSSPKVVFPKSYLVDNTWVSGSKGTISLNLAIQGYTISLNIADAVISMDLADDHKSSTNGTIAGVLDTEDLIAQLGAVAGGAANICPGDPTFESIANQLRQASDILADGSQDPSKTCDGISIGLGFDAALVQLGEVAPPAPPADDPCSGGGGASAGM